MDKSPETVPVDVRYVADLARIALTDAEVSDFQKQLDDILAYVAQLKELNVDAIQPTAHAMPRVNVMRDDVPGATMPREELLANAPAVVDDVFIQVPVVIEEDC